jgi:hypothetical protein
VDRGEEGRPVEKVKAHGQLQVAAVKNECDQYQDTKILVGVVKQD